MGGRTWVESVVGRGSRFHFTARFGLPSASVATLPAETVDVSGFHDERALGTTCPCEPLAITEACRDASTNLSRHRRLLLAEDTVANQKLVSAILEERGHAVYIASNGRAAVEMLQQQNFDLVLMDIQMPVMDGFQATAAIRALPDPAKSRLPIVALTAYAMAHDRERCLTAGMDAYLTKPVASQELIEVVECLAGQSSAGQAVQAPSPTEPQIVLPAPPTKPIESADPAEPVFDFAAVMKHLGGRERLFQEMVAYLGIQAPEIFVEIRRAEEAEDADALGRAAHALKGTLVYLAAAPAVAAAERVEQLGRAGDLAAAGPACRYLEQEVARLQLALAPYHAASWEPHTVT
jgi:CheY-like chemotaxis protein